MKKGNRFKIHSLKVKLTFIMAAVVTSVVILICVLNSTLFETYYINNRVNLLCQSYNELKTVYMDQDSSRHDIEEKIIQLDTFYNINTCLIDSNWNVIYISSSEVEDTLHRFQDSIFNNNRNSVIIMETSEYAVVKNYNSDRGFSYLEIFGTLENGSQIMMQITLDSIQENVRIFNRFVQLVGIVMLIISIVAVYLIADNFTRPVKELSTAAKQMSNMDFSVKYTGKDKSEIGLLGQSINIMSDKLEKNISELKAANIELQKNIEIKDKDEVMRREFLSNVSHELKTPLALIQGYAEGLKEGITDDPESMDYYCDVIIDETAKMNNMVKKLLTLNQIEFGNEPVNIDHINVDEFIGSILKANSLRMEQQGIRLEYVSGGQFYVWFDSMELEEVFVNFLSNAINHCENDKIIRVTTLRQGDSVRISVFNTGKNIPEEDIDHIWEKFYKVDKARTREYGGNGIGLSIVKAILDKFDAPYGIENRPEGVEFWFILDGGNN
ncbi:MAG: sensor histidine kinase [Butyrivibrio sp.]